MATVSWEILKLDGGFGVYTRAALQHYLKRRGYYTRECDGSFGYYSQLALQKFLRVGNVCSKYTGALDGKAGDMTWEAFGHYLACSGKYGVKVPSPFTKGLTAYNWYNLTYGMQKWLNELRAAS